MSLRLTAVALACPLLLAALPLPAQQVYQWKDANGVTQYSGTPPANVPYQAREIRVRDGEPAVVDAAPAEDPGCTTARGNLELLAGKEAVSVDSDGDGKPDRNLDEEERAAQRELAEATIKVKCAAGPKPAVL